MTFEFNDTYEIKRLIGKGGMSTVYLAEHRRLHTFWAVKEVRKEQGVRFDFLAESNILKRLQHPMLPRIVDIFEDQDCIYIVEDFVEGVTLEQLLREQGKVEEVQAVQWFQDLCDVLRYLHAQQPNPIIYRDMKPANIMLQPDGTLKLIDFGIAREYKQDSNADTTYVGTKGYAAPEQFGKAQTDARTDIYSLGVTMYHILSGKSPYEPPYHLIPIRKLDPSLSVGIEHVLNRCTQAEPEERYQSVEDLLFDLENLFRFDKAWKRYRATKRARVVLIVCMLAASIGLMVCGRQMMADEKQAAYYQLLESASALSGSDTAQALALLEDAQELFPEQVDSYREYTYVLYLGRDYQGCVEYGEACLEQFPEDGQLLLTVATAYFELAEYETAAEYFYQGALRTDMDADHLRDYAVCLGRTGDIDGAQAVLETLTGLGALPEVTTYVQGEVYLAQEDYIAAETAFTEAMSQTDDNALLRRCYVSLGDLYRDCAALVYTNSSPIEDPATKSVALLSQGITAYGWTYDSVLWEMLGMAYYEAYHTDPDVSEEYLSSAADCFQQVLTLGIQKAYLYRNLYTIYYELGDYSAAADALDTYEQAFPNDYMPSALRGVLLITIENEKPEEDRDYSQALAAYEKAGDLITGEDDASYYQQIAGLIEDLRANGWLE